MEGVIRNMKETYKNLRVAVIQAAPVIMDKEKTIQKSVSLIIEAGQQDAKLVIFPEVYIPAYPRGLSFGFVVGSRTFEGRQDWKRYHDNSVIVPSDDTNTLGDAAKEAGVYLGMGVTERDELNGTLYCTYLFFDPNGQLVGKHRKLKPTGAERCIWGDGYGSALTTVETPYGIMGSVICWENYMPLMRAAMFQKGVSIYIAPTADSRDQWQATMRHIALEGRCFVIGCNQYVTKSMYPKDLNYFNELENQPEEMCLGGSCIVNPFGEYVAEPVFGKEEIIIADLELDQVVLSKMDFDPIGHYNRPDVLELQIHE